MNERELQELQQKLDAAICSASDNGGVELLEAASYSTHKLARILRACGENEQRREDQRKGAQFALPRGSRCQCPACAGDYRVVAALG